MSDVTKKEFLQYLKQVCEECDFWLGGAEIRSTDYPFEPLYSSVEVNGPDIEDGDEYRQMKAYNQKSAEWIHKREKVEDSSGG